jgi:hypothetical protein
VGPAQPHRQEAFLESDNLRMVSDGLHRDTVRTFPLAEPEECENPLPQHFLNSSSARNPAHII